ncbi:MAG: NAD-dependent malic enzyme [Nocardioidaceae bacterium]
MTIADSARPRPIPTSASYGITVRLYAVPSPSVVGELATAVGQAGGLLTAIDVSESRTDRITVDVTCSAVNGEHATEIVDAMRAVPAVTVHRVSDRTFLLHLGGKISVQPKVALKTRDDLSMAYTPGVGRVSLALAQNPEDVSKLTIKGNCVAVVTDGSAVLGLGNIGPGAALPVMEGKAALFKRFGDIDAWPLCLATQDVDEIVRTVQLIAPVFAGINLEDISAPRCFEIERRLKELLDIPVFHDDQHGTAIVVLAALTNALRVVAKGLPDVRIVMSGAGAAGSAIARIILAGGARNLVVADVDGVIYRGRDGLTPSLQQIADNTNPDNIVGSLKEAVKGSDVFIGVSAPNLLTGDDVATMAPRSIVFALANPDPEVDPGAAREHAAVVATGRSDYPNQINNVLAFPGVFRGLLDASASVITQEMLVAAAQAIASTVSDEELNANYVIPSVFNEDVHKRVAAAVREAAQGSG